MSVKHPRLIRNRPQTPAFRAWLELLPKIHPVDREIADTWQRNYEAKFNLADTLKPQRICEIGVRAGYSAFMFLQACPNAFLLGIDNNSDSYGGKSGLFRHAQELLQNKQHDCALLLYNSQRLKQLPGPFDLVHVDGDHSYEGTYHDLRLAWTASSAVLVDDYGSIVDVHRGVDDFCAEHGIRPQILDHKQVLLTRPELPSHVSLVVDGQEIAASADYSLRFLDHPDRPSTPVLYFQGRRVIKSWTLEMFHAEPSDPWGCSG